MESRWRQDIEIKHPITTIAGRWVGYIYIVRFGDRYKIGRTKNPVARMYQLQIELKQNFDEIHVITADDSRLAEIYLHRKFKAQLIKRKEWFSLAPEQYKVLCNIAAYHGGQFITHTEITALTPHPCYN